MTDERSQPPAAAAVWVQEFPAAITVCDTEGTILEMNHQACETFAEDGGASLIGTNLLDCHPEPARTTLEQMLASGSRNVYTIEKKRTKKFIVQAPWYDQGRYRGFVEIVIPIPREMPHFVRKG